MTSQIYRGLRTTVWVDGKPLKCFGEPRFNTSKLDTIKPDSFLTEVNFTMKLVSPTEPLNALIKETACSFVKFERSDWQVRPRKRKKKLKKQMLRMNKFFNEIERKDK